MSTDSPSSAPAPKQKPRGLLPYLLVALILAPVIGLAYKPILTYVFFQQENAKSKENIVGNPNGLPPPPGYGGSPYGGGGPGGGGPGGGGGGPGGPGGGGGRPNRGEDAADGAAAEGKPAATQASDTKPADAKDAAEVTPPSDSKSESSTETKGDAPAADAPNKP